MTTFSLSGGIGIELFPSDFAEIIREAAGDEFELSFSSVGGFVSDGFEIFNLIRDYPGRKNVLLNGYTASIASYIAMAFDRVTVRDNTPFMIHNALGGVVGDHNEVRQYANHLESLSEIISESYINRTNKSKREIRAMMDRETWLYGSEIIDAGFADEIKESGSNESRESAIKKASLVFNSFRPPVEREEIKRVAAIATKLTGSTDIVPAEKIMQAKSLILNGKFDAESKAKDGEFIRNGVVHRSVLRSMIARANVENNSDLAELVSLIDRQGRSKRVNTKEEALALLKNMRENGDITLREIAAAIDLENQVVTEEQKKALKIVNDFKALGYDDPVSKIKEMAAIIGATEKDRVAAKIKAAFGAEHVKDDQNDLLIYANRILGETAEKDIDEAINEFKNDTIAKKFAAALADYSSGQNRFGIVDKSGDNKHDSGQLSHETVVL